jgi:hypothetical protein
MLYHLASQILQGGPVLLGKGGFEGVLVQG